MDSWGEFNEETISKLWPDLSRARGSSSILELELVGDFTVPRFEGTAGKERGKLQVEDCLARDMTPIREM